MFNRLKPPRLELAPNGPLATSTLWSDALARRISSLPPEEVASQQLRLFAAEATLFAKHVKSSLKLRFGDAHEIHMDEVSRIIGQHLLAEFDVGLRKFSAEQLKRTLVQAAQLSGATILDINFFDTKAGGVSGVVVIAESHFIAHYFPSGYLAVDIYTCGTRINLETALKVIIDGIGVKPYDQTQFKRGVTSSNAVGRDLTHRPGIASLRSNSLRFLSRNVASRDNACEAEHHIIEHYLSDPSIITRGDAIEACFTDAFGLNFQYKVTHEFPPKGIGGTSLVFIGEGVHVTTHPWTEVLGYTPIDVFISKNHRHFNARDAIRRLERNLSPEYTGISLTDIQTFSRGVRQKGKLTAVFDDKQAVVEAPKQRYVALPL